MNPPVCDVCGTEHWAGAPHYSGRPREAQPTIAVPKKPGRGRPISPSPKSPRAEYQRELMRKRRAAAKEQPK